MEGILLIEDDATLADMLVLYLTSAGYGVDWARTGPDGVAAARRQPPDLVLLDIMLPGLDGWAVLAELRRMTRAPVIMLTALGEEDDRVRGLELGADDYVTKPFGPRELLARVQAHLRRAQQPPVAPAGARIELAGLVLERDRFHAALGGRALELTPKEFELLWLMAAAPGRVFTREMLLDQVWGYGDGDPRTLEVHIARLREKLGEGRPWVRTVWGVGYKFEVVAR